ncbi:MAG: glycoside hydrolase family 140 protein, partial [Verrucomicrobiales bacterium]|nr:glycoside hydrolase family 140 protein [Verrucomicrobiales bacterium]
EDMRRLIRSNLGESNQLGDGAPLVWLFNPKCWTDVEIHHADFKGKAVEFSPAKPGETGDVLVIPKAKTNLKECAAEFFGVLRDPALFLDSAAPSASNSATALSPGTLRVADNRRFLTTQDGQPFFWLSDTAWQLIHDLNREEVDAYFRKRAAQGFNVIQTVAIAEQGGLDRPNADGFYPLLGRDPAQPDLRDGPDYWKHVDYVVQSAGRHGLYVALLPTWGSHVTRSYTDGKVNGIFNAANAEAYGRFLAGRYRKQTNVIWVLGGDRAAPTDEAKAVWRAMARGIALGFSGSEDYTQLLMTFHPVGPGSSVDYFPDDAWLDFHGIQSSHGPAILNWKMIGREYLREPARPVIDLETTYAEIVFGKQTEPLSDDLARRAAYWAVFAGACGHTYGHNSVWQMFVPEKSNPRAGARTSWKAALDAPSAAQMGHLRKLIGRHPFLSQRPNESLIAFNQGIPSEKCLALRGDGFAMIYTPTGRTLEARLDKLGFANISASWFNPRTGKTTAIGSLSSRDLHAFDPPGEDVPGNDWVLILDDAEKHFVLPRQ